jgi:[FeFe] hydrogenase H-cluster maturation GTPase HydF
MKKGKDLKPHIGIFGRRNLGKSSLINRLTGQDIAIVSDHAGTTTDPVKKSIEIFGIGPAIVTDTAGIDDVGELGGKRVEKSLSVIPQVDFALLLISDNNFSDYEKQIIKEFSEYDTPYIIVHSKADVNPLDEKLKASIVEETQATIISFDIFDEKKTEKLIASIVEKMPKTVYRKRSLFKGMIDKKDVVLLVTPIDSEAPEGRMILPQVMAVRDVLDNDAICVLVKETELEDFLKLGITPSLAVTDSQAFAMVSKIIPAEVPLTSFSIVLARYKGNFRSFIDGTPHISKLKDGNRILMLESCTHQVSCEDIGRFKLPNWINEYTGKKLEYDFASGLTKFPKPVEEYDLIIQCGGCVVTEKQLNNRLKPSIKKGIPVSNYGMAIAYVTGIFDRVIEPFRNVSEDEA